MVALKYKVIKSKSQQGVLSRAPLSKVCTVLSKYEVEYIIVGGTAVQYYGYHRPSRITISTPEIDADLDFWYKPTNENFSASDSGRLMN